MQQSYKTNLLINSKRTCKASYNFCILGIVNSVNNTYDFLVNRPNEFKQVAVKDVLFLHYICPQVDKYLYLYNHFNQISFTLAGNKTFHRAAKSWSMTEHTTIFAKKGAWIQENGTTGWEILSFYFSDDYLCRFFNEHRHLWSLKSLPAPTSDIFIELRVNEMTRAFFYSIIPYLSQHPAPAENLLELKFKELLFNILSNPDNAALLAYLNSISNWPKPSLYEIMEANFYFNLSISEFARLAQRSISTFKRDFHECFHTTPGLWLKERRVNHAKLLLTNANKNINEVAYDSGFESITHFSRVFKDTYGMSPMQYRKSGLTPSLP